MKYVLLVEDNVIFRQQMSHLLQKYNRDLIVIESGTLEDATKQLDVYRFDLFFIDIMLETSNEEDTSGIYFARRIRLRKECLFTPIVFLTSKSKLELFAFRQVHCFGYLTKPIQEKDILGIVDRVFIEEEKKETEWIELKGAGVLYRIHREEVVFAELIARSLHIQTRREVISLPYLTIKRFLRCIGEDNFIRCHRCIVVNTNYIKNINLRERRIVLLEEYGELDYGDKYKEELRERSGWNV